MKGISHKEAMLSKDIKNAQILTIQIKAKEGREIVRKERNQI